MATIDRPTLQAPDWRAYRDRAVYAAIVGLAGSSLTLTNPPAVTLASATESAGPAFQRADVYLDAITWVQNLQQTTLAPSAVTYTLRGYVDERNYTRDATAAIGAQSNVAGSRAILSPIQPPFFETEWPNPRGPARATELLTFSNWVQNLSQTTLRPGPFPQRDWPVPRGPQRGQAECEGFPTSVLDYAVGLNVPNQRQTDWPNPRGPARAVDLLTWTQNLQQSTLIPTPAAPFFETDWPVPKGLGARQADSTGFPQPILDYAIGLNDPNKRPSDWPVPKGQQRAVDLLTWVQNLLQTTLTPAPPAPFFETDWPVPKGSPPRQDFVVGFSSSIRDYAGGLNDANKRPSDWPVPKGPQRSIDALTWTQTTLPLQVTAAAVKPFLQTDWPLAVPRVYRQIAETRGFELPALTYAVGLNDANKRKYDWPNPIGRPPLNVGSATGFTQPIRQDHVPFAHMRRYDWPVPKGYPPLNVGWVQGLDTADRQSFIPFAHLRQHDWPNPRGPRRSIDALTWTQTLALRLPPGFVQHFVSVSVTVKLTSQLGQTSVCIAEQTDTFTPAAEDGSVWSVQSEDSTDFTEQTERDPWGCTDEET